MNKDQFKFLETAISKDEARKNLMFLEFNVDDRKCTVTATNAYIIKRIVVHADIPSKKYYLEGKQVAKLLKIATNTDIIELTIDGVLCDDVLLKWFNDDFDYPNLSSLIEGSYGPTNKVLGFNANFMAMALKNAPADIFKMEFKQDNNSDRSLTSPTRITFYEFPDYTVLIMPVRISW